MARSSLSSGIPNHVTIASKLSVAKLKYLKKPKSDRLDTMEVTSARR